MSRIFPDYAEASKDPSPIIEDESFRVVNLEEDSDVEALRAVEMETKENSKLEASDLEGVKVSEDSVRPLDLETKEDSGLEALKVKESSNVKEESKLEALKVKEALMKSLNTKEDFSVEALRAVESEDQSEENDDVESSGYVIVWQRDCKMFYIFF